MPSAGSRDCGGYFSVAAQNQSGTIISNNYPYPYPPNMTCIWLLEADQHHRIQLDISPVYAEVSTEGCKDYVEVRAGSSNAVLLMRSCNSTMVQVIVSRSRWLWVKFISDHVWSGVGFQANWSALYTDIYDNTTAPVSSCSLENQFQCANKECVDITKICDTHNDCGCIQGCDEGGCTYLPISRGAMLGIGISVGVTGFAVLFLLTMIFDKHQHNPLYKHLRKIEAEKAVEDEDIRTWTMFEDAQA